MSEDSSSQRYPEAIDEVVQGIYELSPEELVPELSSFLNGHYLRGMVATHGAIQASKAMLAAELAIKKADAPEERTALATFAVQAIGGILHRSNDRDDSFESALVLVAQEGRYADLIEDPDEKSTQLCYAAQSAHNISESYATERDTLSSLQIYSMYLDQAVAAALTIEDAESRATRLIHLASVASGSTQLGLSLSTDSEQRDPIIDNVLDQPVAIYAKALSAAADIPDRDKRIDKQAWIVISMAQKAGYENEINPEQSRSMFNIAMIGIDNILATYSTDNEGAAYNLVELADKLSGVIADKYDSLTQNTDLREQLVDQIMRLFRDAGEHILEDGQLSRDRRLYRETDFSNRFIWAASCLVDTDFEAAEELISLGYKAALLHDSTHVKRSHDVLARIDELAEEQTTKRAAFELKSLAYRLERDGLTGGKISGTLSRNIHYDFREFDEYPDQDVYLEDIDREFVEFIIDDPLGIHMGAVVSRAIYLQYMEKHVQDPELKQRIQDQISFLQDYWAAKSHSTSKLRTITETHWPNP